MNGALVYEACARGCLHEQAGQDDVCMGTSNTWSCTGSYGKTKVEDGDYYATDFGCWKDSGGVHTDPGDNCIPSCLGKAQSAGLCAGLDGPTCEETVNWYAADGARFGCLARLRARGRGRRGDAARAGAVRDDRRRADGPGATAGAAVSTPSLAR